MNYNVSSKSIRQISQELEISIEQIKSVISLLDSGNTIPFIARYRKEKTGGLDENQLRDLAEKISYHAKLEEKIDTTKEKIAAQDKLTPELEKKLEEAKSLQEVEDIYYPYKPRRETRADKAEARGLKPLAKVIWKQELNLTDLKNKAEKFVDPDQDVSSLKEALTGAKDILADKIASDPELKALSRQRYWQQASITSEVKEAEIDEKGVYEQYYDFTQPIKNIPPFRVLAMNRGEEEGVLKVKIDPPEESIIKRLSREIIKKNSPLKNLLKEIIDDAFNRLLGPALEREARSELTEKAAEHARKVFADNLEALLLQRPLPDKVIMGIDPAFRTGCKIAIVDRESNVLKTTEIYPHAPQKKWDQAKKTIKELVADHEVDVIACGNGTASQETEELLNELNLDASQKIPYTIVDEAGASVYSASELASEELPDLDVSLRGAVSIARRLQDPLAELVKIDPRSVGVGLYQHDLDNKALLEELEVVVESVVNRVGVNLNTASPALLAYVAGINSGQSKKICDFREKKGAFTTREQLRSVKGVGPATFKQAAGFLRIYSEEDPLARTPIHPESYSIAERVLAKVDFEPPDLLTVAQEQEFTEKLSELKGNPGNLAQELEVGLPTLKDILAALQAPDRDPRDEVPPPIFRTGVMDLTDLEVGSIMQGTVRNVVDFGAFVDIGLKIDGLVHISELADHYVEDPSQILRPGDIIKVKVLDVDERRERISLSCKAL